MILFFINLKKEVPTTFYSQLIKEQNLICNKISSLRKLLKELPEGELLCTKNRQYTRWLISNHDQPIYLPKSNQQLAESLAARKYYSMQLEELTLQMTLLNQFIEKYQKCMLKSSSLLSDTSTYSSLLTSYFQSHSMINQPWNQMNYTQNSNHPENLINKTLSGHMVRSKSEVIIANALFLNQIPFRYECELSINDVKFYPDFTTCHPESHEIIYWEHFGMMDNSSYRENVYNKLKLLGNANIIPSINLITTYETKSHPIDSEKIQQIIQEYFL